MKTFYQWLLMLCLIVPVTFSSAKCISPTEINDGVPILTIKSLGYGHSDKSTYINASISGHTLTVVFSQNLGDVDVEVLSTSGNFMHNAVDELEVKS